MTTLWHDLPAEIKTIVHAEHRVFNPTHGMTSLQAYITRSEQVYAEYYAEQIEEECEDPLEKIERDEDLLVQLTGRNYAGRIITTDR